MSRQSKQGQKNKIAEAFTALHKGGQRGPARTEPRHGKKNRAPRASDQAKKGAK